MTTQVQDVPAVQAEERANACPECGAQLQAGQQFCVECGASVGVGYRPHPSWRLPAAVAAIVVLLVGAGVAFALTEISSDSNVDSASPAPTTQPAVQPGQPTTAEPVPPAEQTAPQGEATTPALPTDDGAATEGTGIPPASGEANDADSGGEPAEWPADKAAYSVILFSTDTRAGAEAKAREAIDQGIPAGVLNSDDFSSLRAGYWVVFAGQFDTSEEADREAESYASLGFEDGYPRFVKK